MGNLKKYTVILSFFSCAFLLTGCQLGYLIKNGYHQALIIKDQKDVEAVLLSDQLTAEQKRKIKLAQEAKFFAQNELGLAVTENYSTYVHLSRPYVTYIVQAALPMELKYHYWSFPIVGKVPYKGYFVEEDAKKEAEIFKQKGLDTSVRGVRAFSTLGWFKDPILSPMTDYEDDDLVNLIIHETTHATLFIKSEVDFNEQMATFVGNKGTELFYIQKEGLNSPTLKHIQQKNEDENLFSQFIKKELDDLEKWYKENNSNKELPGESGKVIEETRKKARLEEIQKRFLQLKFKTNSYSYFSKIKLNNAILLGYKTYVNDLSQFETLYNKHGNMKNFIQALKKIEDSKEPETDIQTL